MRRTTRRPALPPSASAALALGRGERVLAFAVDDNTGAYVVATTWALAMLASPAARQASDPATEPVSEQTARPSQPVARRPWHLVDAGVWQHETSTLTVTWVDGTRPSQWTFRDQRTLLPETLRERVQASVVLSTRLALGERQTARVAIRQDLATGELIPQTVLGRGTRLRDPGVSDQIHAAMADLADRVGLPPQPATYPGDATMRGASGH